MAALAPTRPLPPRSRALAGVSRTTLLAFVAVAALVVLGGVVRFWSLGAVGFNSDEAVYAGQAAALAGDPEYAKFFAIFRAHPLLVQFVLSTAFHFGVSDVLGRSVMVIFGLAAIPLIYGLGAQLYGRRVGLLAAMTLAVLPYHVGVTRQVLLDGPETTLFIAAMFLLARYVSTGAARYLYVAAMAAGLTFLAKETAILVLPVAVAFVMMTPTVRIGFGRLLVATGVFILTIAPYPISIAISGASDTARQFLLWQLLRRPNHTFSFYAEVLLSAYGWVLIVVAVIGITLAMRRALWPDRLLLAWVFVPLIFFQVWPVKGYQYLLPLTPAVVVLGSRALLAIPQGLPALRRRGGRWLAAPITAALIVLLLTSLAVPTVQSMRAVSALGSLAGTGGLPGGREAGTWIDGNLPQGASFMTIGPTMSNIVQFYGHRRSRGLSVSPNPLHRNPAYDPIDNPDHAIRGLEIQYAAFDVWSASRSPFFASVLMGYVAKYHGTLIYEQKAETRDRSGRRQLETVIRIYEVRP